MRTASRTALRDTELKALRASSCRSERMSRRRRRRRGCRHGAACGCSESTRSRAVAACLGASTRRTRTTSRTSACATRVPTARGTSFRNLTSSGAGRCGRNSHPTSSRTPASASGLPTPGRISRRSIGRGGSPCLAGRLAGRRLVAAGRAVVLAADGAHQRVTPRRPTPSRGVAGGTPRSPRSTVDRARPARNAPTRRRSFRLSTAVETNSSGMFFDCVRSRRTLPYGRL